MTDDPRAVRAGVRQRSLLPWGLGSCSGNDRGRRASSRRWRPDPLPLEPSRARVVPPRADRGSAGGSVRPHAPRRPVPPSVPPLTSTRSRGRQSSRRQAPRARPTAGDLRGRFACRRRRVHATTFRRGGSSTRRVRSGRPCPRARSSGERGLAGTGQADGQVQRWPGHPGHPDTAAQGAHPRLPISWRYGTRGSRSTLERWRCRTSSAKRAGLACDRTAFRRP